ncbi:hypothetical protein TNCV_3349781 [Trichonephila clavipes]|nr:hypothetical protein TNCV_3349781 [Trichonephila clavipes]
MVWLPEEVGEKGFLESRSLLTRVPDRLLQKEACKRTVVRVPTGGRRQKRTLDIKDDAYPDAVVVYPGYTPGKRRTWLLPVDRHTAFRVGLRGRWSHVRMKTTSLLWIQICRALQVVMNPSTPTVSLPNNEMSKKSPFAAHKPLIRIGGEPKSVKRLRSGDLLIETVSAVQTKSPLYPH